MAMISPVGTEIITGSVVCILLVTGLILLWCLHVRQRQPSALPVPPPSPAVFSSMQTGKAVFTHANQTLYQFLLGEMVSVLEINGFQMVSTPERRTELTSRMKNQLARHVMTQRERYMAPRSSESAIKENVRGLTETGFAGRFIDILIRGCETEGWYICETNRQGWEAFAYPLQQVTVRVTGDANTLIRDMLHALEQAADTVRDDAFPLYDEGETTTIPAPGRVHCSVMKGYASEPPGFFPQQSDAGLPPVINEEWSRLQASEQRHIIVIVQATRHSSTRRLFCLLEAATKALRAGESDGAEFDDDCGYAFIHIPPYPVLHPFNN